MALGFALTAMSAERSCAQGPIAFLAAPRTDGLFHTQSVSEADGPHTYQAAAQLIVRDDAGFDSERVLVESGALDFSVCPDGRTLLASIVKNGRADIYRIDSQTGETTQLTDGPGWSCQPVECGDGSIAFLSDRDGWRNPGERYRAFTIYRMAADGREVERIWHAGFGGVFGLHCGPDGRLYFSSGENQGGIPSRQGGGIAWGIWSINPDGGEFSPEISAYAQPDGIHDAPLDWPSIMTDGSLVVAQYYDTRIYGTLHRCPKHVPTAEAPTQFGVPLWTHNPVIDPFENRFGWQRRGMKSLTPWTNPDDADANYHGRNWGHVTHSAPAPENGALVTWTGTQGDAHMNLGVYLIPHVQSPTTAPEEMQVVVDEPNRHEWMGKALRPYRDIYGIVAPAMRATKRDSRLPGASPFGVVGTSSIDYNEWVNTSGYPENAKLRELPDDAAEFIRILAFVPTKGIAPGKYQPVENRYPGLYNGDNFDGFRTPTNERAGFYTQLIPLKKWRLPDGQLYLGPDPPPDAQRIKRNDGRPDSSFRIELPANQCWTFQLLNAKLEAIVTANTWHQVVPGEVRTDCRGCHAHHKPDPVPFEETLAASDEYPRMRLEEIRTIVYERDVRPNIPGVEQRPWDKDEGRAVVYESWRQNFDDNPDWTEEQRVLYRAWQDTGFLAAGNLAGDPPGPSVRPPAGPYDDTMSPTLVVRKYKNATAVGVFDPNSGIVGLGIAADGEDVLDKFQFYPDDHVFVGPAFPDATIQVMATDGRGNETRLERRAVETEGQALPAEEKGYAKSWNAEPPPLAGP
jgi:hypothetical protein